MAGPWEKYAQPAQQGPWTKFTPAQQVQQQPDMTGGEITADVLKSGGSGAIRGTADLVGTPGSIGDAINSGLGWLLKKGYQGVTGEEAAPGSFFGGSAIPPSIASGSAMRDYASTATGGASDYQPQSTAGEYARTVGEFAPAAAIGGLNPVNMLKNAVLPGVASETGGQLTEGTAWEPYARIGGAVLGGSAGMVGDMIGNSVRGPSKAQAAFGRAASADAVSDVPGQLQKLGPDAMPMDLGPNLQRQAGALAATPGSGQEVVRSAIANRQSGAGMRISESLDNALGQPVNTMAVADDIIAQRSAAAKPLYDAAYAKPVPFTKELEETLKRPSAASALRNAQKLAADEGIPSQQWFANIADDGTVTIKNVPDVRQLDLTKRALDDMIGAAKRTGNDNSSRILTQLKDKLVKQVDDAVPEYAAARKAFSGPSAVIDAMEEGKTVFSKTMTPNQLRTQMLKMSDAEKEAFIQGGRASVADIMGSARNDALAAKNMFATGYNKEKLALLVGDEQASKMLSAIDAESMFTKTRDVVTGNSETAARAAAMKDVNVNAQDAGVLREAANLNFGTAAAKMGDRLLGGARTASQNKMNTELSKLLTSTPSNAAEVTKAIKLFQAAQKRGEITAQQAKKAILQLTLQSQTAAKVPSGVPAR